MVMTVDEAEVLASADRLLSESPSRIHRPDRVPAGAVRRRAGVGPEPARIRRAGRIHRAAGAGRRPPEGSGRATEWPIVQRDRRRTVRVDGARIRQRGPEAALPPVGVHRRGEVVPAVQRAGERLRPRVPRDPSGPRRRRVGRERSEGVDERRRGRALRAAARADGSRSGEARRAHRVRHRHARPRRRGPAVASDERRCRLQRSVHVERPYPRQRAAR